MSPVAFLLLSSSCAHAIVLHTSVGVPIVARRDAVLAIMNEEEQAKMAWLAKLDLPTWSITRTAPTAPKWGLAPASFVVSQADQPLRTSEEEAKRAWLAKLENPSWGKAESDAAEVATQRCDAREEVCDDLSQEEEAKKAWLAKLDTPTWGATAAAVSAVAATTQEEEAKRAWLAKLEQPAWGGKANGASGPVTEVPVSVDEPPASEEDAKKAWLAKLEEPTWGKAAAAVAAEVAQVAQLTEPFDSREEEVCDDLSRKEWGAAAAAVSAVEATSDPPVTDVEKAVLDKVMEKVDTPNWNAILETRKSQLGGKLEKASVW